LEEILTSHAHLRVENATW